MKSKIYLLAFILCSVLSCKKDSTSNLQSKVMPYNDGIVSLSATNQIIASQLNSSLATYILTVADTTDLHHLQLNVTLAPGAIAMVNGAAFVSGTYFDLSKSATFTVTSGDKRFSSTFKISAQTERQYFGISGDILARKSLDKQYNFYFDQFDGSTWQSINCGPSVTTMAIKWADSSFSSTPVDARNSIRPGGGWWYTNDIQAYLTGNNINSTIDTLDNVDAVVQKSIDNHNLVILCLDMDFVPYNDISYQHIQKFYPTNGPGWGHFLLVKGYVKTLSFFYLEIYDPYSNGSRYALTGELRGLNRYYVSSNIKTSTNIWWPYAIIVAAKGKKVIASMQTNALAPRLHKPVPPAWGR